MNKIAEKISQVINESKEFHAKKLAIANKIADSQEWNIFDLYDKPKAKEATEHIKREADDVIRIMKTSMKNKSYSLFNAFLNLKKCMEEYNSLGATDTASEEKIFDYINKGK